MEVHREGFLGAAVLQTRGRLRDSKVQFRAGTAASAAAQGHGPVPREESELTARHAPSLRPPATNPARGPAPAAAGHEAEFARAGIGFHKGFRDGSRRPHQLEKSWARPEQTYLVRLASVGARLLPRYSQPPESKSLSSRMSFPRYTISAPAFHKPTASLPHPGLEVWSQNQLFWTWLLRAAGTQPT